MFKKIGVILLGIFFIIPVYASDMATFYYKNKGETQALNTLKTISDSNLLQSNKNAFPGVVGFVVGVIGENPGIEEKIHQLPLSQEMRQCISTAENLLKKYPLEAILTTPNNIQDGRGLDLLWGVFFATGNPKIPQTIRAFVENNKISKAPAGQKSELDLVVITAIWSLESNAEKHEAVKPYATFPDQTDNLGNKNLITFMKEVKSQVH